MWSKGFLAAIAVLIAAQPALATSYLCSENTATQFDWKSGAWSTAPKNVAQYIIRKGEPGDIATDTCISMIEDGGESTTPQSKVTDSGTYIFARGCYFISKLGEKPFIFADECLETYSDPTTLREVTCDSKFGVSYKFEAKGEFVIYDPRGIIGVADEHRTPESKRSSPFMALGTCSIAEP